jgi:diguanylate cyclase (GGDEF)-like protein
MLRQDPKGSGRSDGLRAAAVVVVGAATLAGAMAAVAPTRLAVPVLAVIVALSTGLAVLATQRVRRLQARLAASEVRARLDPLTGLINRGGVADELEDLLAGRRPNEVVGVLSVDVDRLKMINDSVGHAAGDEVLRAVARRLVEAARESDVVGRFGGDEFVVLASGLRTVADLERLSQRILERLAEPVRLSDGSNQLANASIGIAYLFRGATNAEKLLQEADAAMYRAKDVGGSVAVVFDEELRRELSERQELERQLRQAVPDGELVVQYQPVVTAATGSIDSVEALVRWRHPTRGLLPPAQFLSVASESGLIIDLGRHVLHEACAQAVRWTVEFGRPVRVAVNLSERQVDDHSLWDTVADVLAVTGLPPGQLELEISEGLLGERSGRRLEVLRRLADMGVAIVLDDFGTTGSLRRLTELDMVSTLKIDRSLIEKVATGGVDHDVVTAVVAVTRSLGMGVVAEGVETAEQADTLHVLGVERMQGFHFQRPAGVEQVTPLLAAPHPLAPAASV